MKRKSTPLPALKLLLLLFWASAQALAQTPVANFTASPLSGCSPLIVNFQDQSTGSPTAWSWDFGNGNTSALQNPTASYFTPGTYTVRLTATNARGSNTLTRTQYITVYESPTVSFSANNTNGCFPLRVQFTDASTAGAGNTNTSWQWDFGNGTTSTQQNPLVSYTAAGTYTVTLRVTNDKGCYRVLSRPAYINVTAGVTAGFTHPPPSVCQAPATIAFSNTSTGPGTLSYQWLFGDGNTSTQTSPTHTYTNNGTYTAILVATSSSGCEDTARSVITVGGFTTSFTNTAPACANAPINFTNTSSPAPASASWDFGDGNTAASLNASHAYTAPGTYTVTLTNNYGNCSESFSQSVTIYALPVAAFTSSTPIKCEPPLTVNFQDQTPGATTWQWDFGDGNSSTQQNPAHTYTNYGNYTVTLITTNANGCRDTLVRTDYVQIRRPVITIPGLPARGCVPYTQLFSPVITTLDAVTSYQWDFGDGNTSTAATPTHTYPTQGTYTVTLTITTSSGCTETLTIPAAIRVGTNPTADFSAAPNPVCAYQPVQFTDLSVPADEWSWNFGDGTTSTQQSPSHVYTDTGYFSITLIATNNGCPATITRPNFIRVLPPIARFTYTPDCANRLEFAFTDQSIGPGTWLWDFGDGTTSIQQNPVHVFPALGSYNVTLTVTNGSCSHSTSLPITSVDQTPDFTATPLTVCRGNAITFTPAVNAAVTANIIWDWGNGVQVTTGLVISSYVYPASGTYSVRMVTVDVNGCRDTAFKTNYIRVNGPVAAFTPNNTAGCTGLVTTFTDNSTSDGVNALRSWRWDFGDGTIQTFTAPPFQHTYTTAGDYSVKLVVTDASGCSDSITQSNIIHVTDPVPDFVSPDTLSCPNAIVRFTNTSVATPGYTSTWDFGDGNSSTANSPTHTYTATGLYSVTLTITDIYGCTDRIIKNNYIRIDEPDASFTVDDSVGSCTPLRVQFTNTSTYSSSPVWDFGPGQGTSTLDNPVHFYNQPGTYRVKLTVTSPGGCLDSAFINITVDDTTGSHITYTPLAGCNPTTVNLSTVTNATVSSFFWDFGDGNTVISTGPDTSHTYNSFGNFLPKVIMQDPTGCLIPLTGPDTIRIVGANVNFGFDRSLLCDSGTIVFSDSTTTSDAITSWNWNFGDGGTSTAQNPRHTYTAPGLYDVTLTVTTQSNCTNTRTFPAAIKVVQSPSIGINGNNAICVNQSLLHSGIFLQTDTSQVTWAWTFPNGNTSTVQNPPQQTYTTAGNYVVTAVATNSSGCRDTATQNIIVHPLPTVDMPGQMTVQSGFSATIPATYSDGVNTWSWTPTTGLSCNNCPTPDASPRVTTTYTVAFSDGNNCSNTGTIIVNVICVDGNLYMPNTFSPNGDGSNDKFYPRGKGLYLVKALRIFNRWGEVVFERRDFAPNNEMYGWDGKYKGQPPQPGVYVYQVEVLCNNGESMRIDGNIALIQ